MSHKKRYFLCFFILEFIKVFLLLMAPEIEDNPFLISNAEELNQVRYYPDLIADNAYIAILELARVILYIIISLSKILRGGRIDIVDMIG